MSRKSKFTQADAAPTPAAKQPAEKQADPIVVTLKAASAVSVSFANGHCTVVDTGVTNKTIPVAHAAVVEVTVRVIA
jgi:hypothetical protein